MEFHDTDETPEESSGVKKASTEITDSGTVSCMDHRSDMEKFIESKERPLDHELPLEHVSEKFGRGEHNSLVSENKFELETRDAEDEGNSVDGAGIAENIKSSSNENGKKATSLKRKLSRQSLLGFNENGDPIMAKVLDEELVYKTNDEYKENGIGRAPSTRLRKKIKLGHLGELAPKNKTTFNISSPPKAAASEIIKANNDKSNVSSRKHIVGDTDEIQNSDTETNNKAVQQANTPETSKFLSAQDDFLKKPFEYGWTRELVWRSNVKSRKRKADIYYFTPDGKKLRSRADIQPFLEGDLTINNFSFAQMVLGVGEEFETVRNAKTSGKTSVGATRSSVKLNLKPKVPRATSTPVQALKEINRRLRSDKFGVGGTNAGTPSNDKIEFLNDHKINQNIHENGENSLIVPVLSHQVPDTLHAPIQQPNKIFATNFFANASYAYEALLKIFKFLKIHEKQRAASVCKLWNLAAKDMSLWETVRMKNSRVSSWAGFATALSRGETKNLDLHKLLVPSTEGEEFWQEFSKHIGTCCLLEVIYLCKCSSQVVENLFKSNPNLRALNALAITDNSINLQNLGSLTKLEELRLRTCELGVITSNLQPLQTLTKLTQLSLTSISNLGSKDIDIFGELRELKILELGECGDFDSTFATVVLPKLTKLQRIRLENGQKTNCCTFEILDAVAQLTHLSHLELINFDIKMGFDDKLFQCNQIRKLLIVPTYMTQSAATNHIALKAVQKVANTLKVFTWGITAELVRVTSLFVNQLGYSPTGEQHQSDECIPVLKPVPEGPTFTAEDDKCLEKNKKETTPGTVPEVEIVRLDKVESILSNNLPNTKFTIIKIPYNAIWKQQIVE